MPSEHFNCNGAAFGFIVASFPVFAQNFKKSRRESECLNENVLQPRPLPQNVPQPNDETDLCTPPGFLHGSQL
jgi:hypothetical protein